MDKTIEVLIQSGGKVSGLAVLMVVTVVFLVAIEKEWLFLPGPVRADRKVRESLEKALDTANDELREQDKLLAKFEAERDYFRWRDSDTPNPRRQSQGRSKGGS